MSFEKSKDYLSEIILIFKCLGVVPPWTMGRFSAKVYFIKNVVSTVL